MRRRRLIPVALLAFTFGCRTCGTEAGETTYDTFDGKIRLELVRSTYMSDYGWRSNFRLVVHATPQIAIPVPCSKVKFAEAPDGKLFAFHCSARVDELGASDAWIGKWHLVRLLGNGAFVMAADPPMAKKLPWGQTPDFAAVQPLNKAADEIFASWKTEDKHRFRPLDPNVEQNLVALSSALAAESSDAEAAAFLERNASEQMPEAGTDPWPVAFAARGEAARAGVLGRLCSALESSVQDGARYSRAGAFCPLTGVRIGLVGAERVNERMSRDNGRASPQAPGQQAADLLAAYLATAEAGAQACAALGRPGTTDETRAAALLVVGRTGTKCVGPGLTALLARCPPGYAGKVDTLPATDKARADLVADVNRALELKNGRRTVGPPPSSALVAAIAAQAPLPKEFCHNGAK